MKQLLIIPDRNNMSVSTELSEKYSLGFEYNDFFIPSVLDNEAELNEIISIYKNCRLPGFTTIHGAFFDVLPFSPDKRIKEISELRIRQSISAAEKIGAHAVVFHTNYNPFLNSKAYVDKWISDNACFWGRILADYPRMFIYLENMFDCDPYIISELSEKLCVHKNYGVCLDYAHALLSATSPEVWVKELSRYIKHVHINDNDLISDLHLAWGDGKINRGEFYTNYDKYMHDASVLIETTSAENIRRSLIMLEKEGFIG